MDIPSGALTLVGSLLSLLAVYGCAYCWEQARMDTPTHSSLARRRDVLSTAASSLLGLRVGPTTGVSK